MGRKRIMSFPLIGKSVVNQSSIHVAVGVVVVSDQILITQRSEHVDQGGLWEFPGGKIELGESQRVGLDRELKEELGIIVHTANPLLSVFHDYGHIQVVLHTFWVNEFSGNPVACERQPMQWVAYQRLVDYAFPEANKPILDAVHAHFRCR